MKRIAYLIGGVVIIGAMVLVLINNKKAKDLKDSQNIVQTVFPVNTALVTESKLSEALSLVGNVIAQNDVNVTAEATGRITKCNIAVGSRVSAGDVLFQIDDELRLAQLKTAEANFEKAQKDSARSRFLVTEKSMSPAQWDQIELQYRLAEQQLAMARRAYNDTRIKAPISGVVSARNIDVGSMVNNQQSGTVVCNIVDISRVKVKLQVAERDMIRMKQGEKVDVSTELFPDEVFQGTISSIGAKGDEAHTYPVEISVVNGTKNTLRPGMFARVSFTHINNTSSLVIPREAVVGSARDARVYVVENEKAHLRNVVLGADANGKIEVRSGLQNGDRVVTTGQNTIGDGVSVKVMQ